MMLILYGLVAFLEEDWLLAFFGLLALAGLMMMPCGVSTDIPGSKQEGRKFP